MDQAGIETEAALAIVGDDPAGLADEMATLAELGPWRLAPVEARQIRDMYFDTPEGDLARRMVSLRLRQVNGVTRMTIKADVPTSTAVSGVKVRFELERDWSADTWAAARRACADHGAIWKDMTMAPYAEEALQTLAAAGLSLVQSRATYRRPRQIMSDDGQVGELVIDRVRYAFPQGEVCHYEIEIELAPDQGLATLTGLVGALMGRYGEHLVPWPLAKLTFGAKLGQLLADGALRPWLRADGTIKPLLYKALGASSGPLG